MRTPRLFVALATAAAVTIASAPLSVAQADAPPARLVGLGGGYLVHFAEDTPGAITATVPISGLVAGDVMHSIDVRPATGQLFGLGVNSAPSPNQVRLYVIDPVSGNATSIGVPVTVDADDSRYAIDFNPAVDRVRVVGSGDDNFRLNPNNGAVAGVDINLSPATQNVVGIAYDRNVAPATVGSGATTTLFGIRASGALVRIGGVNGTPSPNGGAVENVGTLGVVPDTNAIGFDNTPQGTALASIRSGGIDRLHRVNLQTGAASAIGAIGTGGLALLDIAVLLPAGASQYVGVPSHRLIDTRDTTKVPAEGTITVPVTGRGPIPASGVSAAILNVTVTQPGAPGYTTVWPSTSPITNTSSVNVDSVGQTRAALVTVPLGADGAVKVFSERGSHVIVDVVGFFTPLVDNTGRLHTLTPDRLLDTRTGVGLPGGTSATPGAGATVELQVLARGGVPATGVAAAVLNVTMTGATAPGYVTVFAGDVEMPLASNLNASTAGETIANLVIVPVGSAGTVKLFTEAGAELIVDVLGYFGANANPSTRGAFVPVTPARILDSRTGLGGHSGVVGPGWSINLQVAGAGGTPPVNIVAVAGTVTATESNASGFVTVYPTSDSLPGSSTLNTTRGGQTIANSIVLGLGVEGKITLFSETGAHLITDVTGYFLG